LRGSYRAALIGFVLAVIANSAIVATWLPQLLDTNRVLDMLRANQATLESNEAVDPLLSASRVDSLMVIERLIGRHLPSAVRYTLTFAMLISAGMAIHRLKRPANNNAQRSDLDSLAIASLTIALCIYHNIYDALLVAPAAIAVYARQSKGESNDRRGAWWLLLALLLVPAVNYFTSAKFGELVVRTLPPLASVVQQPVFWTLLCVLNGLCLTLAWCALLVRCFQHDAEVPVQASK